MSRIQLILYKPAVPVNLFFTTKGYYLPDVINLSGWVSSVGAASSFEVAIMAIEQLFFAAASRSHERLM
jgi:hypothetical protein